MAKLRWSKEEEGKVITCAVELRRAKPELSIREALLQSQEPLAQERRKKLFTPHYFKSLLGRFQTAEQKARTEANRITQPAPEVLAPPAPPPAPTLDQLLAGKLRELGEAFGAAFGDAMAKALAPALAKLQPVQAVPMEHAISHPGNGGNGAGHHNEGMGGPDALPDKFKVHKIAVLPLNNTQQQELKSRFPHLDIRFLTNDNKAQQIAQVTKNCEAAFVMTRFVAHRTEEAVAAEVKVRVNGGMTELSRLITARFPKSTSMDVTH